MNAATKIVMEDEDEEGYEWFDRKYPDATCHRCDTRVQGSTVVECGGGGGACETWYCADCHKNGTDDCPVCADEDEDEEPEPHTCKTCGETMNDVDFQYGKMCCDKPMFHQDYDPDEDEDEDE